MQKQKPRFNISLILYIKTPPKQNKKGKLGGKFTACITGSSLYKSITHLSKHFFYKLIKNISKGKLSKGHKKTISKEQI